MRAVARLPQVPWLLLPGHDEVGLIRPGRVRAAAPGWAGLARFPAGWSEVPQSRVQSALQMFVSYHRAGNPRAHYHCAALAAAEPPAPIIARLTLGDRRVSISVAAGGYAAHWNAGDVWHRISGGPADLCAFMELVLGLTLS